jgi:hypothetical protein
VTKLAGPSQPEGGDEADGRDRGARVDVDRCHVGDSFHGAECVRQNGARTESFGVGVARLPLGRRGVVDSGGQEGFNGLRVTWSVALSEGLLLRTMLVVTRSLPLMVAAAGPVPRITGEVPSVWICAHW